MTSRGFSKSRPTAKCFHCGKYGHICRDLKKQKEGHKEIKEQSSTSRNVIASVAKEDYNSEDEVLSV